MTTYTDEDVREGKRYSYQIFGMSIIGEGDGTPKVDVKVKKPDEGPGFPIVFIIIILLLFSMNKRFRIKRLYD